jgi:hypothetical protein
VQDPPPTAVAGGVAQASIGTALRSQSVSTTSQVLDTYLGFRWRALGWLEVFGGFRNTRYDNVGVDLQADVSAPNLNALDEVPGDIPVTVQQVREVDRSVTYEGFYLGLGFQLF